MEPWRTSTVLGLCAGMRAAGDYSAAPILADALQDADYPLEGELALLRDRSTPVRTLELVVALVYSDEAKAAVDRVTALAELMGRPGYPSTFLEDEDELGEPMTYARLMDAATRYATTGDDGLGRGSMDWSNLGVTLPSTGDFPAAFDTSRSGELTREEQFWVDWCLITGRPMPKNTNSAIFRCSC